MSATLSTPKTTSGGEIITHLINSTDGAGLHFDGTDGHIDIPGSGSAPVVALGTKFSFEFIIQADEWPTATNVYLADFGSSGRFIFGGSSASSGNLSVYSGGWDSFDVNPLLDLKVHHIVLTISDTAAILYDNGNQIATATTPYPIYIDSATEAAIGCRYTGAADASVSFFNGTIYRARLWNKTLSQTDVTSVYESASLDYADQWGEQNLVDAAASVFTSGTYSWAVYGSNTIVNVGNALEVTWVNNAAGANNGLRDSKDLTKDLVVGKKYRLTVDAKYTGGASGSKLQLARAADNTDFATLTTSFVTYTHEFIADTATGSSLRFSGMSTSNVVTIDNWYLDEIGCVSDFDFSYANPTQSNIVRNRNDTVTADGTAAGGVVQVTPIDQLNSRSARIGTSAATPADGELLVSGNVGIGTDSPVAKIQVSSGIARTVVTKTPTSFVSSLDTDTFRFGAVTSITGGASGADRSVSIDATDYNSTTGVFGASSGALVLQGIGGNVGIGTPSPNYALEVSSAVSTVAALRVPSGGGSNDKRLEIATGGDRVIFKSYTDSSDAAAAITFQNGTTEAVRIDSTGNVGIGESDPGRMLTVAQATTPTDFSDPILWVGGNGGADSYAANNKHAIGFHYVSSGTRNPSAAIGLTTTTTTGSTKGDLLFATRDVTTDTAPTTRLTISSSGLATFSAGIAVTGNITAPTNPAFNVGLSATQSNIAINGWVTILLDTERFDQGANFNTGTYTFTAPVTGKYQLNVNLRLDNIDTAANYYQIAIATSNKAYIFTVDLGGLASDPTYWEVPLSVLADMDASDTAYVKIWQAGGTAQTDVNADLGETTFSGYLAC